MGVGIRVGSLLGIDECDGEADGSINFDGGLEIVGDRVTGRSVGEIVGESVLGDVVGSDVMVMRMFGLAEGVPVGEEVGSSVGGKVTPSPPGSMTSHNSTSWMKS